jgi:hypothetical protein
MRFGELVWVFRDCGGCADVLRQVFGSGQWQRDYLALYEKYPNLDGSDMNMLVPVELTREVAARCPLRLAFFPTSGYLVEGLPPFYCPGGYYVTMTAVEVHDRFGGSVLEEVFVKGCAVMPAGERQGFSFEFTVTLRIMGKIDDPDAITRKLGVSPTRRHRWGERYESGLEPYGDMWAYTPPVPANHPLEEHLLALGQVIRKHGRYLRKLKRFLTVNVFCEYRSNCPQSGFQLSPQALEIFAQLQLPFGISVVVPRATETLSL